MDGLSDAEIRKYVSLTENLNLKSAKDMIKNEKARSCFDNFIAAMDSILGIKLIEESFNTLKDKGSIEIDESEILKLIEERASAKLDKNYKLADEIRDKLKGMGIILEDQAGKTTWKKL